MTGRKLTSDVHVQRLSDRDIEPLEAIVNTKTPILLRCKICSHEWRTSLSCVYYKTGCPKCGYKKVSDLRSLPFVEHVRRMKEKGYEFSGPFKNAKTKTLTLCLRCGHEWHVIPSDIYRGYGCPVCRESKGEKAVSQWLSENKIYYERQKKFAGCKNITYLPFDFYCPSRNILIEFHGGQHYFPVRFGSDNPEEDLDKLKRVKRNDSIKSEWARDNGFNLIVIPYFDIDYIDWTLAPYFLSR